jgi:hypothetical protein
MDEALSLAEFADKVGTVFLGVALIYALWRQDLVFGKQFKECQAEGDAPWSISQQQRRRRHRSQERRRHRSQERWRRMLRRR